jgi:hypothetical protein
VDAMPNRLWALALNTMLVTLFSARPGWADPNPTVPVSIVNDAHVSEHTIEEALTIAGGVFRRAEVAVSWRTDSESAATGRLTIRIAARASEIPFRAAEDSMGVTRNLDGARATVAYVFFDRVREFADRGHVDASIVLGCATAHELGHLLLPVNAHTADGIMRAQWDSHMIARAGGSLSFAPDQARLLRLRVASREP